MIKFSTEEEWVNTKLSYPDVASIEEDSRMEYLTPPNPYETPGGIVLWDAEKEQKVVVISDDYSATKYPEETFTPIGVLVIPASHMSDGHARMMSTRWMNCDDPENGSLIAQQMAWGDYNTDISGITNYGYVAIISSPSYQEYRNLKNMAYLPSNYSGYTGDTNPQDLGTRWFSTGIAVIASPYALDGSPNLNYRITSYSGGSISNAMSDFDGRGNTDKILAARGVKDYGSWKPTYDSETDYPAPSCCDMYCTIGTNQGDWYLPSMGELGYVNARLGTIIDTMVKIEGLQDVISQKMTSSTEQGEHDARSLIFKTGLAGYGNKYEPVWSFFAFCIV